jgi:hypothetical protein
MVLKPKSRLFFVVDATLRFLVLAYPAEFRAEYGPEMVRVFRDLYWSICAQRGIWGVIVFWFDALTDILTTALVEQMEVFWRDLQDAVKIVLRQPAAMNAIATLALGIGLAAFGCSANFQLDHQPLLFRNGVLKAVPSVFAAMSIYLVVACANVASLLLVEAVSHQKNTSLRRALEANRCKVTRQIRTAGIVLSILGGVVGLLLAAVGMIGWATLGADNLPLVKAVAINPAVLGFTVLLFMCISALLQGKGVKITLAEIQHEYGTRLALDRKKPA